MRFLTAFFAITLFSFTAYSDITITTFDGEATVKEYYKKNMVAAYSNGVLDSIIDFNSETITLVDHENKIYSKEKFSVFLEFNRKMMDNLGAEQKQYLEMVKNAKSKVTKKGSKKISGFSCDVYEVSSQMSKEMPEIKTEICVSTEIQKLIDKEVDPKKFKDFFKNKNAKMGGMMGSQDKELMKIYESGYPVYEIATFGNPIGEIKFELLKSSIPDSMFHVPKDFTKIGLDEFFKKQME